MVDSAFLMWTGVARRKVQVLSATRVLLHEIQHAIQELEGFAKGANSKNGMDAYMQSGGEIESRNVENRMDWPMDERDSYPFNDTLEYPGEALVTFSLAGNAAVVRVTAEEALADKAALVHVLKNLTGQKFTNKAKQMSATVSVESAKKIARAEQETVANLTRLGYTEDEAGMVHRAAAVKIGELYERAELYIEEEVYHKTDNRKAAWHFFEPVTVEMNGREETFLTNISVIDYTRGGERIFSLELTIENPISNAEGMAAPASGRQALHPNGVSNVRVAAFQSFVKKEKTNLERKAREKGLIPWRVDEARLNELRGEEAKVQKEIDALLAKFGGDETKLQNYRRDRIKLHDLREQLAQKQALIAAEYKPEEMPDVSKPKAPNGKDSNLPLDLWLTVRTKAFKAWFGDWEKSAELSFDGSEYNNETCLKMLASEAGTPFVNDETGIEAEINNRQRGKITSGKAQRKSRESGFSTGCKTMLRLIFADCSSMQCI